jgi:hypothetical protein
MAVETAPARVLTPTELDDRRLAVENAIGTLRIENMVLDAIPNRVLEQYAAGEISMDEMSRRIHEYTATII